ncbi:hypothetical protein A2U01_0091702, partial [Trifolium medium]|nr:hypothetical protein [Trifolium medium]
ATYEGSDHKGRVKCWRLQPSRFATLALKEGAVVGTFEHLGVPRPLIE